MSNDLAMSVRGLSKMYTIEHGGLKNPSFREAFIQKLKNPMRRAEQESFWALKDVSFDIKKGDVVGVLGRNGAGKSTLLKILSRIVEPTKGEVDMYGRVGSLLEVGTGFHPELTGRENIYLNGAILGMRRNEIRKQFDAIVDFAEVERFLDTPVKRYSSGMYVRLAFAVAAHLNPEILIVDEVLAVGDTQFQKKCLGKMKEVAEGSGRSVLFVSHNMGAVSQLCNRVVLLALGTVEMDTPNVQIGVKQYLNDRQSQCQQEWLSGNLPKYEFCATRFCVTSVGQTEAEGILMRDREYEVVIEGTLSRQLDDLCIGYAIYATDGMLLYWSYHTDFNDRQPIALRQGNNVLRVRLPVDLLNHGEYRLELIGGRHGKEWFYEPQRTEASVNISVAGRFGFSSLWQYKRPGLLAPTQSWQLVEE